MKVGIIVLAIVCSLVRVSSLPIYAAQGVALAPSRTSNNAMLSQSSPNIPRDVEYSLRDEEEEELSITRRGSSRNNKRKQKQEKMPQSKEPQQGTSPSPQPESPLDSYLFSEAKECLQKQKNNYKATGFFESMKVEYEKAPAVGPDALLIKQIKLIKSYVNIWQATQLPFKSSSSEAKIVEKYLEGATAMEKYLGTLHWPGANLSKLKPALQIEVQRAFSEFREECQRTVNKDTQEKDVNDALQKLKKDIAAW